MTPRLDDLLRTVSRSFYLSLRVLPADIRPAMGVGYLLCRAADSIADTDVLPANDRLALLADVRAVFETFPMVSSRTSTLAARIRERLAEDTSPEKSLLERFDEAIGALSGLSKTDQALVQRVVVGVVSGMQMDLRTFGSGPDDSGKVVALADDGDLERYLEWIGGEPGRFWTDLCAAHRPALRDMLEQRRVDGVRFGTGLQLVNILRDLPADLKRGRCYIPSSRLAAAGISPGDLLGEVPDERFLPVYHELIDSAVERMKAGVAYVTSLPGTAFRMRAAVWWPLVIGLRTLALLRGKSDFPGSTVPVKVGRREIYWLLATSAATLPFNRLLWADFDDLAESARSTTGLAP